MEKDMKLVQELMEKSIELRKRVVDMVYHARSGHIGGSLSSADILSVLYFHVMKLDPENPRWEKRDRFVLSKGHISPAYYSALAMRGFFPVEELKGFRQYGSMLQGHPDRKHIPGVDMSAGSLGQGISAAVGMAIAAKLKGRDHRVYALLGDGELQEGQVWEALMLASHRKLDNLCIIVDNNDLQCDGHVGDVNSPYPIDRKMEAFNLHVIKVNGHDFTELLNGFALAGSIKGRPTVVLAKTLKGKGVSFMEGKAEWHGKVPNEAQYRQTLEELEKAVAAI